MASETAMPAFVPCGGGKVVAPTEMLKQHADLWRRHAHLAWWRPHGWTAADCEREATALETIATQLEQQATELAASQAEVLNAFVNGAIWDRSHPDAAAPRTPEARQVARRRAAQSMYPEAYAAWTSTLPAVDEPENQPSAPGMLCSSCGHARRSHARGAGHCCAVSGDGPRGVTGLCRCRTFTPDHATETGGRER